MIILIIISNERESIIVLILGETLFMVSRKVPLPAKLLIMLMIVLHTNLVDPSMMLSVS